MLMQDVTKTCVKMCQKYIHSIFFLFFFFQNKNMDGLNISC